MECVIDSDYDGKEEDEELVGEDYEVKRLLDAVRRFFQYR